MSRLENHWQSSPTQLDFTLQVTGKKMHRFIHIISSVEKYNVVASLPPIITYKGYSTVIFPTNFMFISIPFGMPIIRRKYNITKKLVFICNDA